MIEQTRFTPLDVAILGSIRVTFNGDDISDVARVDIAEGWVEVLAHDKRGNMIIDGDQIATVRLHGEVSVEFGA